MGLKCLRLTVLFFNILFFLSGVALLGFGVYLRVEDDYANICEQYSFANSANLCIAAGAIIFFIAAFGCLGAAMKSSVMLGFFFFLLLLILIIELAAGVLAFVYRQELIDEVEKCLNTTIEQARGGRESLRDAWKAAQKEFDCCGVNGIDDWGAAKQDSGCDVKFYTEGCIKKFEDESGKFLLILGGLCVALTLIEILGMICAVSLMAKINKEKKYSPKPKEDYGKF